MPTYFKYTFPPTVDNVFIDMQSDDDLCTFASIQSFNCPVYDVTSIGAHQGHYQTMSSRGSFNVYVIDIDMQS
jgi:hypothetical protein